MSAHLAHVQPVGASYEMCASLNGYISVDIVLQDVRLTKLFHCFRAAARAALETCRHPILNELATNPVGRPLSGISVSAAAAHEDVIEELSFRYLQLAHALKLIDLAQYDPSLVAHLVLEWILDDRRCEAECSVYRHSWRVEQHYREQGWHILAPWIVALSGGAVCARSVKTLSRAFNQMVTRRSRQKVSSLLISVGLSPTPANVDLVWFLCANRHDVCIIGSGNSAEVVATELLVPDFELFAELALSEGWVHNPCRARTYQLGMPCAIQQDRKSIRKFRQRFGADASFSGLSDSALALKAALWQRQRRHVVCGLPKSLRSTLISLLEARRQIVKITDLRSHLAAPKLRIDPFSVEPGRLLVYAPSSKFLEPDNVAFVLEEWVQDEARRRGRISADRILTPLGPVIWPSSDALFQAVRDCRSFQLFGVTFWHNVSRKLRTSHAPHAKQWVDHQLMKHARRALRRNGFVVIGEAIFSLRRWPTIPHSRSGLHAAADLLLRSADWEQQRQLHPQELATLARELSGG